MDRLSRKESRKKPCVVVVDDEPDFILVAREWLTPFYDFVSLRNGKELLRAIAEYEPNLVVLDVNMPGEDGFTLCRKIRENSRFAGLPILFITARTEQEDFIKGWEMGGTSYLTKPIIRSELLSVIRKTLPYPPLCASPVR